MMNRTKMMLIAGALVLAGFGGGAALAMGASASAANDNSGSTKSYASGHAGETPLTGAIADKVKAAALAKYPGATIDRLETDSDGTYEAHMTTKAGEHVTVQVDKAFKVTDTQTGGGRGGRGHHDGEAPLTGATADKVKAAALVKYPGATIDRLETDSDGVYEAHITTKAGEHVTVHLDKSFKVTGTQTGDGPGDHGDHGDHDGDGPSDG